MLTCSNSPASRAFTILELLVVVALLALGAAVLFPALAKTAPGSDTTRCLNNLRQVAYGTLMYTSENLDTFPALASRSTYGFHPDDWIYWRGTLSNYPLSKSPVAVGFSGNISNLFRCPADRDDTDRIATTGPDPYYYSYSITGFGTIGPTNLGIASVVDSFSGRLYPFKISQVKRPAGKIMFAEEQVSYKPGEASNMHGTLINDGHWIPDGADALTARHNGMANIAFSDGHVLSVLPSFGKIATNSRPDL